MTDDDRNARPFDSGLQPERTALAWRRTALAILVGALVGTRILSHEYGLWALLPGVAGVTLALTIMIVVHRRHLKVHQRLTSSTSARIPLNGGMLAAIVALATLAAGVLGLVVVLL